ncbi:NAD(P)/FAD-dependent oxidoreductase [Myxococcus sp. NMCA1]|uniref:NAD(P)/FAD-dependent oxidoreductase n=1 Tax=Myxococcus sp. NMCA1 TaxID=2996785 RepID=UPI0022856DCB|nr:tryptophan 7-halogenase [Myxococcus sp. NMCA1]WAM29665.1 tryptophan 7-halogenase [Myxococcus sp. NMCA1]
MKNGMGTDYDVAILGSGISGSLLAAILAKRGARVVMIDAAAHPKFAVGESTVGHTSSMLELLGMQFDIPEFVQLSTFMGARKHIASAIGIKRGFAFIHHDKSRPFDLDYSNQLVISPILHGPEAHWYRQDIDAYVAHIAVRYGCDLKQQLRVKDIDLGLDKVTLVSERNERITCRYLVDAAGPNSPVARQQALRDTPTRCKTHSRSIFTHMIGVKPFDDVLVGAERKPSPVPWFQCTLHHIFDGGWLWVIPFNNHKWSTNPLCSVGLQLDPRRWPVPEGITPEQEFNAWLKENPVVERQFVGARAVREWVSVPRLQYSSKRTIGHRYCLLGHAAGFIDPLFSRGLAGTMMSVHSLSLRLLEALKDDDFDVCRFETFNRLQQGLLNHNDELVNSAFIAFRDFELWNAFFRVWVVGEAALDFLRLLKAKFQFKETQDERVFHGMDEVPYPGLLCPDDAAYKKLWDESVASIEAVERGEMSSEDATRFIVQGLQHAQIVSPALGLTDPSRHHFDGSSVTDALSAFAWGKLSAPESIKQRYAGLPAGGMLRMMMNNIVSAALRS